MSDFLPQHITKPWGRTQPIAETPGYSLHFCEADAGGFCSIHLHRGKWNRFYVRSGVLMVWRLVQGHWRMRFVDAGETLDVPPGVRHRFFAPASCRFWEVYWPERGLSDAINPDDIVRFAPGGRHDADGGLLTKGRSAR